MVQLDRQAEVRQLRGKLSWDADPDQIRMKPGGSADGLAETGSGYV